MKMNEKTMNTVAFFEEDYVPYSIPEGSEGCDLTDPVAIFRFLQSRVHRQESYCRDAAMILYNHLRGITSRNMVCGPAGSGKTYVWQCLREIYPNIIIVDASTLTKQGWKGDEKVDSFAEQLNPEDGRCIVVFDEFDKLASPSFSSDNENVSARLQSEFLKLIEGRTIKVNKEGNRKVSFDTSVMTFVLCGSFAEKAKQIARKNSSAGLGFNSEAHTEAAFERELELKDIIEFGVIPEIASRVTRLVNIRPLTEEDFLYLILRHPNSPVRRMEKLYGLQIRITEEKCREMAREAFASGLGVRAVTAKLQRTLDAEIFLGFEKKKQRKRICIQ